MFDNYQPNQQTPTTPSTEQTKVLRFDKGYIQSIPGILKIVELACNFIGFICIKFTTGLVSSIFYNLLYWLGIILSGFLFLMYLFHFVEKFDSLPWLKVEFVYCGVMVLTYIVTSIIAATFGENGWAVGFFGFLAVLAYAYDGYLKYKLWKRGLPAQ